MSHSPDRYAQTKTERKGRINLLQEKIKMRFEI